MTLLSRRCLVLRQPVELEWRSKVIKRRWLGHQKDSEQAASGATRRQLFTKRITHSDFLFTRRYGERIRMNKSYPTTKKWCRLSIIEQPLATFNLYIYIFGLCPRSFFIFEDGNWSFSLVCFYFKALPMDSPIWPLFKYCFGFSQSCWSFQCGKVLQLVSRQDMSGG